MSTATAPLKAVLHPKTLALFTAHRGRRLDLSMLCGIGIVAIAMIAGIAQTGIDLAYFFQPTGICIVIFGTLGVTIITTPAAALRQTGRRLMELMWPANSLDREELIDEIVACARIAATRGALALEPVADRLSNGFLRDAILLGLDVSNPGQLQAGLESRLRLEERQGEADAKVLEIAGGFAPTIGVLGTVVGLIDVLRRFSSLSAVAAGMGIAFVSTIYGLALANLVLLPAANRIRARVAEAFELQELMMEGVLCLFGGLHPQLIRQRLDCYRPETHGLELVSTESGEEETEGRRATEE